MGFCSENVRKPGKPILKYLVTYWYSGLRGLEVTFPPHDPSDAGLNPTEVVEFLRTEKFREQVLREGL
jgi:hypothetical protein